MTAKRLPLLVLIVALVTLGGSVAWAVAKSNDSGWTAPHYASSMMGYTPGGRTQPINSIAEAKTQAQRFADRLGLKADEVLQFERNYYVKLVDAKGNGATEVLVDPPTGFVSIEYGPAMMWNTRYGTMSGRYGTSMMNGTGGMMGSYGNAYARGMGGGMMGGSGSGYGSGAGTMGGVAAPSGSASASVSLAEAHTLAQRWLDANQPGVKVESGGDSFPGYYTLETLRDGKITGMISVNASSGVVWSHWWHGAFVAKSA